MPFIHTQDIDMFLITLYDCDEQASLDRDAQSEHRRKKIEALKVSEISVPIYPLPTELTEKQVVLGKTPLVFVLLLLRLISNC